MTTLLHRTGLFFTLLTYGSIWVSPELLWVSGVLSLMIPVCGVGLLLVLGVALLKRYYRAALYTLVVLLIGLPYWRASIGGNALRSAAAPEGDTLCVLSQNVRNFSTDTGGYQPNYVEQLAAVAEREAADVLCLQEFREVRGHEHRVLRAAGYPYRHFLRTRSRGGRMGVVIYARFPITDVRQEPFGGQNGALFATLQLPNDKRLRIGNLHLRSLGLPTGGWSVAKTWKAALSRFKHSITAHVRQIKAIEAEWQQAKRPVLLCGDFNTTPYSYLYRYLRAALRNSFEHSGDGFGITYRGKIPFLRIDHQFFSKNLHSFSLKTIQQHYSDHHLVVGTYRLNP